MCLFQSQKSKSLSNIHPKLTLIIELADLFIHKGQFLIDFDPDKKYSESSVQLPQLLRSPF